MGDVANKVLGATLVVGSIVGWVFRHFIEALFFDLVIKILTPFVNPLLPSVTKAVSAGLEYGPPALLGFSGLLFLYLGLRRRKKIGDSVRNSPNAGRPSTATFHATPQFKTHAAIEFNAVTQLLSANCTNVKSFTSTGPGDYLVELFVPLDPEAQTAFRMSPATGSFSIISPSRIRVTVDPTMTSNVFLGFGEKAKPGEKR